MDIKAASEAEKKAERPKRTTRRADKIGQEYN